MSRAASLSAVWFLAAAVPSSAGKSCPVARAIVANEGVAHSEEDFRIHYLRDLGWEFTKRYLSTGLWARTRKVSVKPREQTVEYTWKLPVCSEACLAK